jgi:acetylornithine deacetylase
MERLLAEVARDLKQAEDPVGEWLSRLVRYDSSNPPGGEREAQLWLASELAELGLLVDTWDVLPGRPNTVARWPGRGGGRSLILNGHVDVAEVRQPELWTYPPFGGLVRDGAVHGRGSSDMKAGLAGFVFALKALRAAGFEPDGDIIVESVMGEERSEPGTRACLDRGYVADFAIVGEDTAFTVVANVGTLTGCVMLRAPDTLHVGLRRQYLHAGGGLEGANLLEKAALTIIPALNALERHWANQHTHPLFPHGQELITPFLIEGGGNPYITPDLCKLYFLVSYLPDRAKQSVCSEVEDHIRRAADADTWLRRHPPTVVWQPAEFPNETAPSDLDQNSPAIELLRACHAEALGSDLDFGRFGFASDVGWLYQAGIPAVCYGPGDPTIAHGVDERMSVRLVVQYAAILGRFIAQWTTPARARPSRSG